MKWVIKVGAVILSPFLSREVIEPLPHQIGAIVMDTAPGLKLGGETRGSRESTAVVKGMVHKIALL